MQNHAPQPAQIGAANGKGRRVLVVEDDLLNRMFYSTVLEGEGYEVQIVNDGSNVMAEVAAFRPDLITMDIHLPGVSGLDLIKQLQKSADWKQIPILAITAFAGRGEEARIRRAGARGYIAKPVTIARLTSEIEALLPR